AVLVVPHRASVRRVHARPRLAPVDEAWVAHPDPVADVLLIADELDDLVAQESDVEVRAPTEAVAVDGDRGHFDLEALVPDDPRVLDHAAESGVAGEERVEQQV